MSPPPYLLCSLPPGSRHWLPHGSILDLLLLECVSSKPVMGSLCLGALLAALGLEGRDPTSSLPAFLRTVLAAIHFHQSRHCSLASFPWPPHRTCKGPWMHARRPLLVALLRSAGSSWQRGRVRQRRRPGSASSKCLTPSTAIRSTYSSRCRIARPVCPAMRSEMGFPGLGTCCKI